MAANPEPVTGSDGRTKAALWFAEHGFGVFSVWSTDPDGTCRCAARQTCGVPGKHPITINGFQDATTDVARIRTMLAAASHPNYGLVCPEGVFAWDVDGEGWQARLAALEAQHGPLPPTLRTDTANGQHVFLRWPDALPRPMHKMFGWVTRWGSGKMAGYVIGPRSIHATGREYTPSGVFDIATLPETWARAALAGESTSGITIGGRLEPEDVLVGSRHDALRNTARHYAGTVRDPEALFAAVWAYNERLPQPKTREEVQRAIGDALIKYPADPVEEDPDTGELRRVPTDEPGLLPPADGEAFPDPPARAAFVGLLGEAVDALATGTDASEVGILAGLLAFCGALVPASSYFHRMQTTSPYLALVGESSVGRKGTAMFRAKDALSLALGTDVVNRARFDGLASGESLVNSLSEKQRSSYDQTAGVVMEEEYATHLAASARESSSLDSRMRQAFDGDDLYHRKVSGTITVQTPYWLPALIAITPAELRTKLPSGALTSGSGNRWLWLPVVRRKVTVSSTPPELPAEVREALQEAHRAATKQPPELQHAPGVSEALSEYDEYLWSESVGIAADMTRRFSIIAFRVAMIHAAVERSPVVGLEHVARAVALTEYARSGLGWVFGETLGNRDATHLLRQLKENGTLTAQTLSKYLIRDPLRRQDAIDELVRVGLARVVKVSTGRSRPRTELHTIPERGEFRAFRALIRSVPEPEGARSARKSDLSTNDVRGTRAEVRGTARDCPSCHQNHPVGTSCSHEE